MGAAPINAVAVAALADEPLDWRFKGLPAAWWGRTPADVCADGPNADRRRCRRTAVRAARRGADAQPRDDGRVVSRPRGRPGAARQDTHGPAAARPPVRRRSVRRHRRDDQPAARLPRIRGSRSSSWPTSWSTRPDCDGSPRNWTPIRTSTLVCWVDSVRGVRHDGGRAGSRRVRAVLSTSASRSAWPAAAPGAGTLPPSTRWRARRRTAHPCGWSGWRDTRRRSTRTSRPTALARVAGISVGDACGGGATGRRCSRPTASS